MAALTFNDITDLVNGTLRHLGEGRFQQIAQNLQEYEIVGTWFKKDRVQFMGGIGIQRNLMNRLSNQAAHISAETTDSYVIPTLLSQVQINWRDAQVPWGFDTDEIIMNSGDPAREIVSLVKLRRADAMISMAEELEKKAWQVPASTDNTTPYGLPYWIVYNATTGFNGGAASGYTTVGGVSLTTSPTFKNYTANYTNVTKADLIKKMRTAHRKILWRSPVTPKDYSADSSYNNYRIYTNESQIASLEDLGEGQNENIGRDLATYAAGQNGKDLVNEGGTLLFRRHPIRWVPQLDDTSVFTAATNPFYMINHSTFYPCVHRDKFLRESGPYPAPNQHRMVRMFIELKYNYLCIDRRRNAVLATA